MLILQADPSLGGVITDADAQHAIDLLSDGRLLTFPECGHSMHMEDPHGAIDATTSFLEGFAS